MRVFLGFLSRLSYAIRQSSHQDVSLRSHAISSKTQHFTKEQTMNDWISQGISNHLWVQPTVQEVYPPAQEPRGLSLSATDCEGFVVEAAPYNDNVDVLPYFGIMFSLDALDQPFNITTLELDLRSDVSIADYGVKVYMYPGSYETIQSTPSAWTLVANTTAEPLINSTSREVVSYVLPAYDFSSFRAEPRSRVSIFVTMNGAYIDNTVNALDNSGESALVGSYFTIYTGTGLSNPEFAQASVDSVTSPKFAGKVHFQVGSSCATSSTNTSVQYQFVTNATIPDTFYSAVVGGIEDVIKEVLSNDEHFKRFQSEFGLKQVGSAAASAGADDASCDENWTGCLSAVGTVSFSHSERLNNDEVRHRLYALADHVTRAVLQNHLSAFPSWSVLYVGQLIVVADYRATLSNVPSDRLMSDVQARFLRAVFRDTLKTALPADAEVLFLEVENQVPNYSRRNLNSINPHVRGQFNRNTAMQPGELTVEGKLYMLHSSSSASEQLVETLNSFTSNPTVLLEALAQAILLPGEINRDGSFKFFKRLTAVETQFQLHVSPDDVNDDESAAENNTSTAAPSAEQRGDPTASSSGDAQGEPQSILSGDALQQVNMSVWIGLGVGVGLLLIVALATSVYCFYFKQDDVNGKCNHTDDGSLSLHEEVDDIFLAPESRKQVGRSRSFDGTSPRPAQGRQLPQRSKSSDGATFHDRTTTSSQSLRSLRRERQHNCGSEIAQSRPARTSRAASFDLTYQKPEVSGGKEPPSRGLKRATSSDGAFPSAYYRQPLPTNRGLQRSVSSGGVSLGGIVRQPAPKHCSPTKSRSVQGNDLHGTTKHSLSEARSVQPSMRLKSKVSERAPFESDIPHRTTAGIGTESGRETPNGACVIGEEAQRSPTRRGVQRAKSNEECGRPSRGARRQLMLLEPSLPADTGLERSHNSRRENV